LWAWSQQVDKPDWGINSEMVQELFYTWEDHAFNINLGVKFVKPFIFTGIHAVE